MAVDLNRVSELYGIDARDPNALRSVGADINVLNLEAAVDIKRTRFFTHFTELAIPAGLTTTNAGTPVTADSFGTGLTGEAVLKSDDVAAAAKEIATGLWFQANRQPTGSPLVFECRWKAGTLATREFFLGLSDAVTDGDSIALSATSTFTTSVPTNGVYMGYSATPTSGGAFTSGGNQHVALSINANTDAVVATGGGVFATATYYTYRIEVDVDGTARYYVNGQLLTTKTSALAVTVPLCGYIVATPRATAGSSEAVITLDYLDVSGA